MTLRLDREEIWRSYNIIQDFLSQHLSEKKFCQLHGYSHSEFCGRKRKILYMSIANPVLYAKHVSIARLFMSGGIKPEKFIKIHDISRHHLNSMCTHLKYIDMIEQLKLEKQGKPMQFIKVPSVGSSVPVSPIQSMEAEVVKAQNDVELIISKGVKVVVAPEVGADKLIRIIELLKDL